MASEYYWIDDPVTNEQSGGGWYEKMLARQEKMRPLCGHRRPSTVFGIKYDGDPLAGERARVIETSRTNVCVCGRFFWSHTIYHRSVEERWQDG